MSKAGKIRLTIYFLLFLIFISLGFDTFSRHTKGFGAFLGFYYGSVLLFIISLIMIIIDVVRKTKHSFYPIIILCSLLIGTFIALQTNNYFSKRAEANAEKIMNGLHLYYLDNKKYPDTLDNLIPKYLMEIPKVRTGFRTERYYYTLYDRNHCNLDWFNYEGLFSYSSDEKKIERLVWTSGMD